MSSYKPKIYIAGYSGHAFVVIDALLEQGKSISGYLEKTEKESDPYEILYLGSEEDEEAINQLQADSEIVLGIGSNRIREKVYQRLNSHNFALPTVISNNADVSDFAKLSKANFVNRNAAINTLAKIGRGVIINTGAIIEHECNIGHFSHVAPGAVLAGNVRVGKGSFIGANSVVKEGIQIGDNAIVGAGAVVIKNVPDGETWIGNPAKPIEKR